MNFLKRDCFLLVFYHDSVVRSLRLSVTASKILGLALHNIQLLSYVFLMGLSILDYSKAVHVYYVVYTVKVW